MSREELEKEFDEACSWWWHKGEGSEETYLFDWFYSKLETARKEAYKKGYIDGQLASIK